MSCKRFGYVMKKRYGGGGAKGETFVVTVDPTTGISRTTVVSGAGGERAPMLPAGRGTASASARKGPGDAATPWL